MRHLRTLFNRAFPKRLDAKAKAELAYWKGRATREGGLDGTRFAWCYTELFELQPSDYDGKRILDIGCGPRGSLEWATLAKERVGLDPLAKAYLKLGARHHQMRYVEAFAEAMPFEEGHFDVVSAFNCLGHVDDLDRTLDEMTRVLAPGGNLLVIAPIGQPPSITEPRSLSWSLTNRLATSLVKVTERRFELSAPTLLESLKRPAIADGAPLPPVGCVVSHWVKR